MALYNIFELFPESLSARRAWIEISTYVTRLPRAQVALRKESVDRNNLMIQHKKKKIKSLSARRAWIEMPQNQKQTQPRTVALRKESVDRNFGRAEEKISRETSLSAGSAWIEIDVIRPAIDVFLASLSARRAWIEISNHQTVDFSIAVALRKESVDRNAILWNTCEVPTIWSLSARRAWIEILFGRC